MDFETSPIPHVQKIVEESINENAAEKDLDTQSTNSDSGTVTPP